MKKKFAVSFSVLALLLCGIPLVNKEPAVEAHAVSTTRLYVVINDDIVARAPAYKLYNGSSDVDLALLSTVDSRHNGDIYTYFTDSPGTGWKTLKNNGGQSINLYNIDPTGYGSNWDTITFNSPISESDWSTTASVVKSIYTPPVVGEQYDVSLYNGATLLGTQTAYEGIVFTPSAIAVSGYDFKGWFTDAELTIPYVPSVLTGATSLYGKYEVRVATTTRIFLTSTNAWWYNASALTKIYYWVHNVTTAQVQTMTKETINLHSVILPDNNFNRIKLERVNPSNPTDVWNATGDITVNLAVHPVIKLTGALDGNGWTGPLTPSDFVNDSPYIAALKSGVPALSCSNYANADTLLATYNGLAENEKSIIDNLHVTADGDVEMSYIDVINYYVSYAASQASGSLRASTFIKSNNSISLLTVLGLGTLAISAFYLAKKKKSIS